MAERTLPIVTISPNPPVFDLPVLVAQAEGLFARAGVEVRFSAPYEQRSQTERDVVSRLQLRPARAQHARRADRRLADRGRRASDPLVRPDAPGAARPRERAGRGQ
jgi:hypothetical protein